MTVSSETSKVTYSGNGSTDTFAYTFLILDDDEILVQKKVTSTGVLTTLIKTTDYTVSGVGEAAGGNIVLVDPATDAPSGSQIVLTRNMTLTQETDYNEYDNFPAESHEEALDRLTMIDQQQSEELDRSLKLDPAVSGFTSQILGTPTGGQFIQVNAGATGFSFVSASDVDVYAFPSGTGILVQSISASTATVRTLTGTAAEITVTNGDGVSGNPTISLSTALTFTGKTVTGGTFASPTMSGTIAGAPTLSGAWTMGTPASIVLTNATGTAAGLTAGAVAVGGITGLGTGVGAALAIAVNTSGGFITSGGTPSGLVLTNATGLPVSTGVSGLGTGVGTFLGTPSSANLLAAITDETGTGALVFANSPTLVTPTLGTPASGTLTNCTGLPESGIADGAWTSMSGSIGVTGFIDNNLGFTNSSYKIQGSIIHYYIAMGPGTSNSTAFTITGLPYAPKYGLWHTTYAINNGGNAITNMTIAAGATTLTCYNGEASGNWTASGAKQIPYFYISYEIDN